MYKRICSLTCVLLTIFFLIQTSYAVTIDKIVVFGDSLSDNGNIFALTSFAHKNLPLIPIIPKSPPYYEGRFSNGPVWIDNVAAAMDVPLVNYAYGGSWAEPISDSKLHIPFGLGMQVNFYLVASALDFHKENHLFVIWSGANDYIQGRDDPEYATTNTIDNIRQNMETLMYYGAKNIVVLNIPNLSVVPEVVAQGPAFVAALNHLSQLHNEKFAAMINKEKQDHSGITIIDGNVTEIFNDIMANPVKYNLKNVSDPCYDGGYWLKATALMNMREIQAAKDQANLDILNSPSLKTAYVTAQLASLGYKSCSNPDEYLFWDHIHPTAAVHKIMSNITLAILEAKGIHA